MQNFVGGFDIGIKAVYLVEIFVELIIAQLKVHINKNEKTSSHTNRQPNNVDQRKTFVPPKVAECDFNIVLYHGQAPSKSPPPAGGETFDLVQLLISLFKKTFQLHLAPSKSPPPAGGETFDLV
jgi:hypothetical protein